MDYDVWGKVVQKGTLPEQQLLENLSHIQGFRMEASERKKDKTRKYQINRARKDLEIYSGNIVSGVAYRAVMKKAEEGEKDEKGANALPENGYKTYVITQDGKMLVDFSERYAILKESSKDQQTACMRLLRVMMTQDGQRAKATKPGETAYPILESAFMEFPDYNSQYSEFVRLVDARSECVLAGSESRAAQRFAAGLGKKKTEEELQRYCEGYVSE